jgi:hypothetical protein
LVFNPEIAQPLYQEPSRAGAEILSIPFLKQKPDNGFRLFILGESPLHAYPDSDRMHISQLLKRELEGLLPDKQVEVIPLILHANHSLLLYDISKAITKHKADAVIIYLGHSVYYPHVGQGHLPQYALEGGTSTQHYLLSTLRSWRALHTLLRPKRQTTETGTEEEYTKNLQKFESSMQGLLGEFQRKKIPTLLSAPLSKLQNQEPFLSEAIEAVWEDSLYLAHSLHQKAGGNTSPELRNLLRQLYLRYPQHAGINYLMGMHARNTDAALPYFIAARDFDQLRLRADSKLIALLEDLAKAYSVQFSNAYPRLAAADSSGIPSAAIFADHVHFTRLGKYVMAKHLAAEIAFSFGLALSEEDN